MSAFCKRIAEAKSFSYFIFAIIIAAGVVVGLQTYREFELENRELLNTLDAIILGIFVLEVIIKMVAQGKTPWRYFNDPWNIFDFTIVVVCLLPIDNNQFVAVLRLARVLRVLKLVSAIPRLQILVGAVLKSIPSIGYVFMLALLHFYIYGCMATFLFSENDPIHFRNLETSMLSLFRGVTLEDWTDLMYINMYGSESYGYGADPKQMLATMNLENAAYKSSASPIVGAVFFVSFILTGAMIVLNLFIGVMLNGMDEAKKERDLLEAAEREASKDFDPANEILALEQEIQEMNAKISEKLLILNKRIKEEKQKKT